MGITQALHNWTRWRSQISIVGSTGGNHFFLHSSAHLHLFAQNNVLITGGEDSKVNAWPFPPLESETSTLPSLAGDVDVAMEVETTCTTRKRDWESEDARQAPPEHVNCSWWTSLCLLLMRCDLREAKDQSISRTALAYAA